MIVKPPVILTPPARVLVAVVVAVRRPTVGEATETKRVPSNWTKALSEKTEALVPPLPIPKIPVMFEVRSTRAAVIAPAVALRKPPRLPIVSPPPVMFKPPANVLVAVVEVALK